MYYMVPLMFDHEMLVVYVPEHDATDTIRVHFHDYEHDDAIITRDRYASLYPDVTVTVHQTTGLADRVDHDRSLR